MVEPCGNSAIAQISITVDDLPLLAVQRAASLLSNGRPRNGVPAHVRLFGFCTVTDGGCWEYQGTTSDFGYGLICFGSRSVAAHRVSWEIVNGTPGKLWVLHRCDNPPCVNPDHLFLGDCLDNNRDRQAKGRARGLFSAGHKINEGSRCSKAKLSESDIPVIRALLGEGIAPRQIAAAYGVDRSQISGIKNGRYWLHVATTTRPQDSAVKLVKRMIAIH